MRMFTIDKERNHITLHATVESAEEITGADRFQTEAELAELAADWPGSRLIATWNSLPGVSPVKRFKDHSTALNRIWKAIQSLEEKPEIAVVPDAVPDVAQRVVPQTPNVAPVEAPRKPKANRKPKLPTPPTNENGGKASKTNAVLVLMKQPGGATLKAIMEATNWQAHSVRGFISGTLAKKMGLSVRSNKDENGDRRYSIPS